MILVPIYIYSKKYNMKGIIDTIETTFHTIREFYLKCNFYRAYKLYSLTIIGSSANFSYFNIIIQFINFVILFCIFMYYFVSLCIIISNSFIASDFNFLK